MDLVRPGLFCLLIVTSVLFILLFSVVSSWRDSTLSTLLIDRAVLLLVALVLLSFEFFELVVFCFNLFLLNLFWVVSISFPLHVILFADVVLIINKFSFWPANTFSKWLQLDIEWFACSSCIGWIFWAVVRLFLLWVLLSVVRLGVFCVITVFLKRHNSGLCPGFLQMLHTSESSCMI